MRDLIGMAAAGPGVHGSNGRMSLKGEELLAVLRQLPRDRLLRMRSAGAEVVECMRRLAARGSSVAAELIGGQRPAQAWDHYPSGDAVDPRRRIRYYYHCHGRRPPPLPGEHGHFHLFRESNPSARGSAPTLVHLAALSVDAQGLPIRVFAANRWVTGGAWRSARTLARHLEGFRVRTRRSSVLVDRWLSAVVRLFYPQLCLILERRDARLRRLSTARSRHRVFVDRRIPVLSACRISLSWQFQALERALAKSHTERMT
ncbi:MAG: hypothetical protein QJR02_07525 [Sinobacteraceae bacterium]|nr:hypothetical protein [Nevskiaceae bacterium]